MHEKRPVRCAQVTGGKPPQMGQGREGGRIRNFTDSVSRRAVVFGWMHASRREKAATRRGALMRDSLSR